MSLHAPAPAPAAGAGRVLGKHCNACSVALFTRRLPQKGLTFCQPPGTRTFVDYWDESYFLLIVLVSVSHLVVEGQVMGVVRHIIGFPGPCKMNLCPLKMSTLCDQIDFN